MKTKLFNYFRKLLMVGVAVCMFSMINGVESHAASFPQASGTAVAGGGGASIDYSNTSQGYVMAKFGANNGKRIKVQVKGPISTYTYDLAQDGQWDAYPLSEGNGAYNVTVYQQVDGNKYTPVASASFNVVLVNELVPYLYSNQYVDYQLAPQAIAVAAQLMANCTDELSKVDAVYNYVVRNISYDKQLAATVTSGYLPVLDYVLTRKQGICFDYASLMTGMLRSQDVPCKLVVGYTGNAYHAWINVFTQENGWIDGAIYFDGNDWKRMDPTFASSGNQSSSIMQYIGNGANYVPKYYY